MFCHYFILLLCVVAYCNQDGEWFNCKPKPGCSIAQCDPRPASQWFGKDGLYDEYPILCQQNEASSSADTEIELLKKKNAEMEKDAEESKKKTEDLIKQIDIMKKENADMEMKIKKIEKDAGDVIKRIVSLENKNAENKSENGGTSEKETSSRTVNADDTTAVLCPVKYGNKCFFPVTKSNLDYDGGVAKCESLGGHLANIYSQTHMDDVMKYIRENRMDGYTRRDFRLGMKYDPKAKKLTLRDGTDAPAGLKWYSGAPYNVEANARWADRTNVILRVNSDQFIVSQYLHNYVPKYACQVLCQNE